jgi:hypothetical protein
MTNSENTDIYGQIYGNTTYTAGKVGFCLHFDNQEHSSFEYIQDYATLEQLSVSEFSVSLWVKYEDNASDFDYASAYSFGSKDEGGTFFGLLINNDKKLNAYFYHDNHNNLYFRDNGIDLSDGNWHHIVVTVSKDEMQMFKDGEPIAVRETGFDLNIKRENQYLGLFAWNNEESKTTNFIGKIDEIRVYNYSLNEQKVMEIFEEERDGFTHTFYLPHFVNSNYWETVISLTNFSSEKQSLLTVAYNDNGEKQGEKTIYIDEGAVISLTVTDLIPSITVDSGWLEIKTYSDLIKGMATYKFLSTEGETSLPVVLQGSKAYYLPVLHNLETKISGIAFTNIENIETTVTLLLKGEFGQTIKTESVVVPPLSKKSFMLTDIFGGFEDSKVSLTITSSTANIVCYGLTFINNNKVIVAIQGFEK